MAKKKSKHKKKPQSQRKAKGPSSRARSIPDDDVDATSGETRGAEALTVALILSAMATLLAEVVAVIAQIAMLSEPQWRTIEWLQALPRIMLMVAAVTGVICLILNPVVSRLRQVKLPLSVTVAITIMAVTPWLTLLLR